MKKSVKLMSLLLSLVMVMSFAACGDKENANEGSSSEDKKATIATQDDLKGKKIAVQEGTTGDLLVTDSIEGAEVSRFKKAVDCGVELLNGRVDAVVLDKLPAEKIVEKNPGLKIVDVGFEKEEYAIAVNKGNTELINIINTALQKLHEDGSYDKIRGVFMPDDAENVGTLPDRGAIKSDKKLIMGTNAEFEPFEFINDKGEISGFDIEVAYAIAKEMGAELVIENMAFDSLIGAVTTGKIDMAIAGMSVTEERKQNVDFSDPYFSATQVVIVKE